MKTYPWAITDVLTGQEGTLSTPSLAALAPVNNLKQINKIKAIQ